MIIDKLFQTLVSLIDRKKSEFVLNKRSLITFKHGF